MLRNIQRRRFLPIAAAAPSQSAAQRAVRYGLISAWSLEDLADSFDSNTLTNTNVVTFAPGKLGNAAQFVPANAQFLSRADNAGLSTGNVDSWVCAWMNPTVVNVRQTLASKGGGTISTEEYVLEYFSPTTRFRYYTGDAGGSTLSIANGTTFGAATAGQWHYAIGYHDAVNDIVGISINGGVFDTITTAGRQPPDTTNEFRIGRGTSVNTNYMNGAIDACYFGKSPPGGIAGLITEIRDFLWNNGAGRQYADW